MNIQTETALVTIETINAVELFAEGGVAKVLTQVKERVAALNTYDPATKEGRDAIKSLAYKVARTKTGLDDLGKEHVAELKRQAGVIDADRKTIRDTLDALRDEVRKPVDEWEDVEKKRIEEEVSALEAMQGLVNFDTPEPSPAEIAERFAALAPFIDRQWGEDVAERAQQLIQRVRDRLAGMEQAALRREREQAELAELRAQQAEQTRKAEAERLAKEQADREAKIREEAEANAKAEAAAAEQRAIEAEAARKRAEEESTKRAEAAAEAARLAEQRRQEAAAAAEEEARLQRERDTEHRKKINNAAVSSLMTHAGLDRDAAKKVVAAIAKGNVQHITIAY